MFDLCGWLCIQVCVINIFVSVLIGNMCSALLLAGPKNSGSLGCMEIQYSAPPYDNLSFGCEIGKGCCRNTIVC